MTEVPPARDVLFLHPVALDSRAASWLTVPSLRAVSFPGHGPRERARPGFTLDDMADELADSIERPVDVVGCSLGGMVAMHLALRHPQLVASMVLAFTTGKAPRDVMLNRAEEVERRDRVELADETMRRWFSAEALAAEPLAPPVAYARERLLATEPGAIADVWRAIADQDVLEELRAVRVPTTCVAGTADQSTPLAAVSALAEALPDSRLVTMDGPHMAFLETPDAFTDILLGHLARLGGTAEQ